MDTQTFNKFFKVIKLLELVTADDNFTFSYGYNKSESVFSIDMAFEDGNFKMQDYTNMDAEDLGEGKLEFTAAAFARLYDGIIEYLEKVNRIEQIGWITDYLEKLKK